jgi:hypothetical protein
MTTIRATATPSVVSWPNTALRFAWSFGATGENAPQEREMPMLELVDATYRLHSVGNSVIPQSVCPAIP